MRPAVVVLVAILAAAEAGGQRRGFGGGQRFVLRSVATSDSFDGAWHFCRLEYRGRAWATDFPDADYNFSTRFRS